MMVHHITLLSFVGISFQQSNHWGCIAIERARGLHMRPSQRWPLLAQLPPVP